MSPASAPACPQLPQAARTASQSSRTARSWRGDNAFGQLGDGTLKPQHTRCRDRAQEIALRIAAGANHSLALKSGGALHLGANANSQLGVMARPPIAALRSWSPAVPTWWRSAEARATSGGINTRGELFLWGDNYFGQVGNKAAISTPTARRSTCCAAIRKSPPARPPGRLLGRNHQHLGQRRHRDALVATGYEFPAQTVGTPTAVSGKFKNQALTQDITGISAA